MKSLYTAAFAAIAIVCVAGSARAETRETVSVRVSTAGLDLASDAGRGILESRIHQAVRKACAPRGTRLDERFDSMRCTREMTADAATRLAAIGSPRRLASLEPVRR